jgi:hypothetical protein
MRGRRRAQKARRWPVEGAVQSTYYADRLKEELLRQPPAALATQINDDPVDAILMTMTIHRHSVDITTLSTFDLH